MPGVELKDLGYDHCGEQEVKGKQSGLILLNLLNRGGSRNHMARRLVRLQKLSKLESKFRTLHILNIIEGQPQLVVPNIDICPFYQKGPYRSA